MKKLLAILLVLVCLCALVACGKQTETPKTTEPPKTTQTTTADGVEKTGVWAAATYLKDTTLGEGAKTMTVEVKAEGQTVTFTVKTDEKTVGAALQKVSLIAGEQGAYGLYIKSVNGIVADYDIDQTYWAFYENGEYAMTGADATDIKEGVTYRFERTK